MSTDLSDARPAKPVNRHAPTALERQKSQLERLFKDPTKPAYIPASPMEKTIRPAREMMKNVQGSSAGAGSGEFHVYKASRRREYERLKLMDEASQKEAIAAEFERKRKEAEDLAEAKTAKNRAKRQKKKERAKGKASAGEQSADVEEDGKRSEAAIKKRRLVSGKELVFRRPGEDSDEEEPEQVVLDEEQKLPEETETTVSIPVVQEPRINIHEDD